jgi:hypothetical protein
MKTETSEKPRHSPLQTVIAKSLVGEKSSLQIIYKSDLANHHFAQHNNKIVNDATGWDSSWFTNYE